MSTLVFDTLQYARRAKEVGFSEAQAEFQAEEFAKAATTIGEVLEKIRDDIGSMQDDIGSIKKDLHHLKTSLTATLTLRFGGMLVASVSVLSILITLLHR